MTEIKQPTQDDNTAGAQKLSDAFLLEVNQLRSTPLNVQLQVLHSLDRSLWLERAAVHLQGTLLHSRYSQLLT